MRVLLDTNILIRSAQPADPNYQIAVDAVVSLRTQGHDLCLVPQNFYESGVVSTRSVAQNGRGKTPDEVAAEFAFFEGNFTFLPDDPSVFAEWKSLVTAYKVSGKPSHDARLVAAMLAHGVAHILTFNDRDFRRYAGIAPMTPGSVLTPPGTP
jgi:predicted nucleic acid-binding protein